MAFRLNSGEYTVNPVDSETRNRTPRELVDKYSGQGLQFRVKYVGSENVNRRRGDAEAARHCLPTLRTASKNMRAHKPKAVLGLNLKGVSLYDERSKSITRVPVDKVTYVSHDPEDQCYFGVIIQTKESHTGFRLYCFKAERPISVTFVNSSRELFDLIMKLRQAKKRMKEEKEEADKAPQDPDTSNLPAENAPPPSYISVSKAPDRPPPPMPKQAPAMPPRPQEADMFSFGNESPPPSFDDVYDTFGDNKTPQAAKPQTAAMSEWGALESELNAIGAPTATTTTTYAVPAPTAQSEYMIIPPPAPTGGTRTRPQPGVQPPPPSHPPPPANPPPPTNPPPPSSSGFDDLSDVFSGSGALTSLYGNQPQAPPTFAPPPQPNPFGMAGPPPPPNYPPPPVQEPSITMDLMDAIRNPQQNTATAFPIGMGMRMPGLGMGPPGGYGTGQFQFGGGMGGFPSGPPPPPQSHDIFSLPADPLLDSNFSQPLLPTNTGGAGPPGGGQPPQGAGGKIDAFSDLVSIARDKTTSKPEPAPPSIFQPPPTSTETPPPLPYRPPDLDFTDAPPITSGPAPSGFDDTFGALPPPPGTGAGFGGGMDMFGDSFTSGGGGAAPPPSGADSWMSFN